MNKKHLAFRRAPNVASFHNFGKNSIDAPERISRNSFKTFFNYSKNYFFFFLETKKI